MKVSEQRRLAKVGFSHSCIVWLIAKVTNCQTVPFGGFDERASDSN